MIIFFIPNSNYCSRPHPLGTRISVQLLSHVATFQPSTCPMIVAQLSVNTGQPHLTSNLPPLALALQGGRESALGVPSLRLTEPRE